MVAEAEAAGWLVVGVAVFGGLIGGLEETVLLEDGVTGFEEAPVEPDGVAGGVVEGGGRR